MSASVRDGRLGRSYFDSLYAREEDPWDFATSEYERDKYRHTLDVLGDRRFDRALEVGCSIGVFTAQLAPRCEALLALDISEPAVEAARGRTRRMEQVTVEQRSLPEEMPAGRFDLIVCSEVLYYLDPPAFAAMLDRLHGTVLAVHWRHPTQTYPLSGDAVHGALTERFGPPAYSKPTADYLLDRWDS
jgi:SAM-dependent methyltransferase